MMEEDVFNLPIDGDEVLLELRSREPCPRFFVDAQVKRAPNASTGFVDAKVKALVNKTIDWEEKEFIGDLVGWSRIRSVAVDCNI